MLLVKCRDANRKDLATNYLTLERLEFFALQICRARVFPADQFIRCHALPAHEDAVSAHFSGARTPARSMMS
jgi:hypothetical protein